MYHIVVWQVLLLQTKSNFRSNFSSCYPLIEFCFGYKYCNIYFG